jgi:hypothetical protein
LRSSRNSRLLALEVLLEVGEFTLSPNAFESWITDGIRARRVAQLLEPGRHVLQFLVALAELLLDLAQRRLAGAASRRMRSVFT